MTGCRLPLYEVLRRANGSSWTLSHSREHPVALTGDKGSTFGAIHQIMRGGGGGGTTEFTLRTHENKLETSHEKGHSKCLETTTSKHRRGKKKSQEESKNVFK